MRFSICIPTYEMRGKGTHFLNELFESLDRQTFRDFEAVVSDHSQDEQILEVCEQWKKRNTFALRYLPYSEHRGSPEANRANAIRNATGDIVKPLDQDDFLYDKDCLQKIHDAFAKHPDASWGITGYIYTDEYSRHFYESTALPIAICSKPSVIFYKNPGKNQKKSFRAEHHALLVVEGTLVALRSWPFQASKYVTREQLSPENRRKMAWLSTKRTIRKYILNPLQKK